MKYSCHTICLLVALLLFDPITSKDLQNNVWMQIFNRLDNITNAIVNIEKKFDQLESKFVQLEEQYKQDYFPIKDNKFVNLNESLIKLGNIEQKVQKLESQYKNFNESLNKLEEDLFQPSFPSDCMNPEHYLCQHSKCIIQNTKFEPIPFWVACDHQTDGGGWIIVQRRTNGSVNFQRQMADYEKGFGNIEGDFWIGLDKLHAMTAAQDTELYIRLKNGSTEKYSKYALFRISNKSENYKITKIQSYSGNGGNCFGQHEGYKFVENWWTNAGNAVWSNLNSEFVQWCSNTKGSDPQWETQIMIRPIKK